MQIAIISGKAFQYTDEDTLVPMDDCVVETKDKVVDLRTARQSRTMWSWLNRVSIALNDAGLDLKKTIKADVNWNKDSAKLLLWDAIQKAVTKKTSSTKLTKDEWSLVYETLNRLLGDKFSVYVELTHDERLRIEQNYKDK